MLGECSRAMSSEETTSTASNSTEATSTTGKRSLSMLTVPPSAQSLAEIRALAAQPSARVDELAALVCQDPVIVIELLKTSNSVEISAGRPPATTVKQAIDRLGAQSLVQVLDRIASTPSIAAPGAEKWLELGRRRCRIAGRAARYLAEVAAKTLVDDCEVAGLLVHYGELLALVSLGEQFVKLANENPRVKLLYRLEKDHRFDTMKNGITYLRRFGVPEAVMFGIDPEAQSKAPGKGAMKMICQAASEIAIAFETEKWEKYAPGQVLPPKSPIRMLALSDPQYAGVYDKCTAFLRALPVAK